MERLFEDVRAHLPSDIAVEVQTNAHVSQGVLGRFSDTVQAFQHRGPVNHVLGDVHYLTWLLPTARTILTVHDCASLERLQGWRQRVLWLLWFWLPAKKAARITVVSEFSRDSLLKWVDYPSERIDVIPPPVSEEFVPSEPRARGDRARLLQIGTTPNKNVPRVLQALDGLPVKLVIVGVVDDAMRGQLEASGVDTEVLVGLSREAMVAEYAKADAVLLASTYEGFGMPIVEAQAVGRPVVTSNVCSMPFAAGEAACFVDPFDVADIRRGVQRVIEDDAYARELVEAGFENTKRFAPEKIAAQYAAIYRALADDAAP